MPKYDFTTLSPIDFEDLVRDLLQVELDVRFESFGPGRDLGIDFRYTSSAGPWIVQAKHYAQSGMDALIRTLKKEDEKVARLNPSRYILTTSVPVTPESKARIVGAMPSAPLVPSDILGREDLNNLLGKHPGIERQHFKLWLSSVEALDRVLHASAYRRTQFEMDLIGSIAQRFVHNASVPKAEQILAKYHSLIISGAPGVGKTTLAQILLWLHAQQGWRISIIDDLKEVYEIPFESGKHLILFDDFLGQIGTSPDVIQSVDRRLGPLMEKIRMSNNIRIVLTTRDYILQKARATSDRLDTQTARAGAMLLALDHLTRPVRAKIVFNHLFYSDISAAGIEDLLTDKFIFDVIDHRNFSPRIIEIVTSSKYIASADGSIRTAIRHALDNPSLIWERPFREHIGEDARVLLYVLHFNGYVATILELQEMFTRALARSASNTSRLEWPSRFRRAVREIEGSFISVQAGTAGFANPGVRDYLTTAAEEDFVLPTVLEAISSYGGLKFCWAETERMVSDGRDGAVFKSEWFSKLDRIIESQTGTALQRLEMILTVYSKFGGVEYVHRGIADLDAVDPPTEADQSDELDLLLSVVQLLGSFDAAYDFLDDAPGVSGFILKYVRSRGAKVPIDYTEELASIQVDTICSQELVHAVLDAHVANMHAVFLEFSILNDADSYRETVIRLMDKYDYENSDILAVIAEERERFEMYEANRTSDYRYGTSRPSASFEFNSTKSTAEDSASDQEIASQFSQLRR